MTAGILDTLADFKARFNDNPRAHKLVQQWDRTVLLESTDTKRRYKMEIEGQRLIEVGQLAERQEIPDRSRVVHLQADEAVLMSIFSGQYNPATAVTDGAAAVFSEPRDKVKLEALAMVLWRLG